MMFREENLFAFVFLLCIRAQLQSCHYSPKPTWAFKPLRRLSTVHFRPIGLEKRTQAAKAVLAHLIFMARVNPCPSLRTFSAACLAPVIPSGENLDFR
jgi:hypothetical protein